MSGTCRIDLERTAPTLRRNLDDGRGRFSRVLRLALLAHCSSGHAVVCGLVPEGPPEVDSILKPPPNSIRVPIQATVNINSGIRSNAKEPKPPKILRHLYSPKYSRFLPTLGRLSCGYPLFQGAPIRYSDEIPVKFRWNSEILVSSGEIPMKFW